MKGKKKKKRKRKQSVFFAELKWLYHMM